MFPDEEDFKVLAPFAKAFAQRQAKFYKIVGDLTTFQIKVLHDLHTKTLIHFPMGVVRDSHTNVPISITKNALLALSNQGLIRIGRKITVTSLGKKVCNIPT